MDKTKKQKFNIELEQIVPEYYSKNMTVRWLFHQRLKIALDYVRKINSKVLVDIGCGDGSFIKLITNKEVNSIDEIWAIDINPSLMQFATRYPDCNFRIQNIIKTDFRDQQFDTIVCLDVLEHIKDIKKAINELRRILVIGGHLITSEPVESFLYKLLRFSIKGTFSQKLGPGASAHYYKASQVDTVIKKMKFEKVISKKIPFYSPFDLFHLNLYQKK